MADDLAPAEPGDGGSGGAPGTNRRRRWPWVLLGVAAAAVTLALGAFYLGGGWYFSGQVHSNALEVVPYDPASIETGTLTAVDIAGNGTGSITITRDDEFAAETKNDGATVGVKVGDTLLIAGPASKVDGANVTRPVTSTIGTVPAVGAAAGLVRDVWLDPKQAGMTYEDVTVNGPAGPLPAWWIKGSDATRWAVLTHGKGATRGEMLRMAQPLVAAGYNALLCTYRNDDGAPQTADHIARYGATEWEDLQACVEWVTNQGVEQLVLGGVSHGAAVTLGFMSHSDLAKQVDALILDSPAASLRDVIDAAADFRSIPVVNIAIPESLQSVAIWMTSTRYGIDMGAVDYPKMPGLITVPTLVFQGTADETSPQAATDKFVAAFSQYVTYVKVPGADHVLAWNFDPKGYDAAVRAFLAQNDLG